MPAIEYLLGLGSPFRGSSEITGSTISTNHVDARMGQQPIGQDLLVTASQHLDGLVPF
jgi:hypothetical protein